MVREVDIAVVGAGLSGLACAQALLVAGRDVLVAESAPRAGGWVATERLDLDPGRHGVDGAMRWELGPEALQDSSPQTTALLAELGLAKRDAPAETQRRFVLRAGRLVELPLSPAAFLTSPLLSLAGRLRALREPFRARDMALSGSIADFVRHRLGDEVLARLVDPFVSGIFAGDPEQISLRAAFPRVAELVVQHGSLKAGLEARRAARREAGSAARGTSGGESGGVPGLFTTAGGLGALPAALAAALGDRLHTGLAVTALARRDGPRSGWRLHMERNGVRETWETRQLVLAVPAPAAAALLVDTEPRIAQLAAEMRAESVASVVTLWRREQVGHALDGFGYLVPSAEGQRHLGTLFSSSIAPDCCPPGTVQLRTLLGGARAPQLAQSDDETLRRLVLADLAPLLGLRGDPLHVAIARSVAALPRYDLAQPERQDLIDSRLADCGDLLLLGNWRRGLACTTLIEQARAAAGALTSLR